MSAAESSSAELVARVAAGLPRTDALITFEAACRRPDTLFITEKWFAPHRKRLLAHLSDPITEDEAYVLREVLWQRVPLNVLFVWLAEKPGTWADYQAAMKAMAEHQRWRTMVEGIFPWPDVEAARANQGLQATKAAEGLPGGLQGNTCPCCSRTLTWVYFSTRAWTWQKLCGRAGWLGLCDHCHMQVEFKLMLMN